MTGLQWGRNFFVTEIMLPVAGSDAGLNWLQWGP